MNRIFGALARSGMGSALDLDFTRNDVVVDSRITCSSGANGTRVNSAGLLVAATCPRIDFDPVTLACKGLLIEEARQNGFLFSEQFDNAAWGKNGTTTIVANSALAPDGSAAMDKLVEGTGTSGWYVTQSYAFTSGVARTISIWVKSAGNSRFLQVVLPVTVFGATLVASLNPDTGAVTTNSASVSAVARDYGGGRWRFEVTATPTATVSSGVQFRLSTSQTSYAPMYAGDGSSGVHIWGAQNEPGAFATSYVPTTSAAVTRSADSAVISGAAFTQWYRADEGTIYLEGAISRVPAVGVTSVIADIGAGGAFGTSLYVSRSATAWAASPTTGLNLNATISDSVTTDFRLAVGMATNNVAITLNGSPPSGNAVDTSCSMPASPNKLTIGNGGWPSVSGSNFNGVLRRITYYPRRLTGAELQALTS